MIAPPCMAVLSNYSGIITTWNKFSKIEIHVRVTTDIAEFTK
jgi:hypothetical protein